jgi:LacI family transcriptional regulator
VEKSENQMKEKAAKVTLRDIARKASCSVNTASKVLSGQSKLGRISTATTKKIKQIASQLGYVPNQLARNLRARRTGLVGVFLADMTDPVYAGITHAVLEHLSKHGFFPLLTVAEAGLDICRESWIRNRVEGLILCGTTPNMSAEFFSDLKDQGLTSVIAGNYFVESSATLPPAPPVTTVHVNNQIGVQLAMDHLVKHGRKRIAFLSGPPWHSDAAQRRHAYESIVARLHSPLVIDVGIEEQFWRRGCHAAGMLSRNKRRFDAIVAYDDRVAIGAIKWLVDHGIVVPDDVAVIGFDNQPQCEYAIPSLSSIEQPVQAIGRKSVELLQSNLKTPTAQEHVLLTPSLIVRDSTKKSSKINA